MAQTSGGMSFRRAAVDIASATDAASWAAGVLDNVGAAVAVSGGSRKTDSAHTLEGDKPIIGSGKLDPIDVAVRFIYSEASDEGFEIARAIYETEGGVCFLRYSPGGDSTANGATPARFETSDTGAVIAAGIMTEFKYPEGDVESAALILGGFTVRTACLFRTTVS